MLSVVTAMAIATNPIVSGRLLERELLGYRDLYMN